MMQSTTEAEILQNLRAEYEQEGFEIFLQPRPPVVPAFLKDFQPDAIARRGNRHVVVEIVGSSSNNTSIARLADAIRAHPGWELRVVLAQPVTTAGALERQSSEAVADAMHEVGRLLETGQYRAALLMAWSSFEALARSLMFDEFQKPQSPGRLVSLMAQEGYLTPSEADQLRLLSEKRNTLIHGGLQTAVEKSDIELFRSILERLAALQTDE